MHVGIRHILNLQTSASHGAQGWKQELVFIKHPAMCHHTAHLIRYHLI